MIGLLRLSLGHIIIYTTIYTTEFHTDVDLLYSIQYTFMNKLEHHNVRTATFHMGDFNNRFSILIYSTFFSLIPPCQLIEQMLCLLGSTRITMFRREHAGRQ